MLSPVLASSVSEVSLEIAFCGGDCWGLTSEPSNQRAVICCVAL